MLVRNTVISTMCVPACAMRSSMKKNTSRTFFKNRATLLFDRRNSKCCRRHQRTTPGISLAATDRTRHDPEKNTDCPARLRRVGHPPAPSGARRTFECLQPCRRAIAKGSRSRLQSAHGEAMRSPLQILVEDEDDAQSRVSKPRLNHLSAVKIECRVSDH